MVHEGHPVYRLYKIFWEGLDWLIPPQCGGCQAPGNRWCESCQAEISPIPKPICFCCGNPVVRSLLACEPCRHEPPAFEQLRSLAVFEGPIQRALHRLKYRRDIGLGAKLATLLYTYLKELRWNVDAVIPVPLSKERLRERGYNQAALIALPLALKANLPYLPRLLTRGRDTRSQVGLSFEDRQANMDGAFLAAKGVEGKRFLILDDVATTGATQQACALALRSHGAAKVFGLTVARTVSRRRVD